jgi:outer membrane lipoprotein-sorting protein
LNRLSILSMCLLLMTTAPWAFGKTEDLSVANVVKRVQQVYSRQCCFHASFDQLTVNVAMDLKDRFKGTLYVKTPGLIALDVDEPERQYVVLKGRTYGVYFPADGNVVRGEVPPEMNLEHFFGFLAAIGDLERNFTITAPPRSHDLEENLVFLELSDPKNPVGTYRILVGVDMDQFWIRRAIIYDALGNYNRFDLSEIAFVNEVPDWRFQIPSGVKHDQSPSQSSAPEERGKQ